MKKKLKLNSFQTRAFFRAFVLTLVCIGCVSGIYLGFCASYEAIRKTCFNDDRRAVILDEKYIKFFDMEIFADLPSDND